MKFPGQEENQNHPEKSYDRAEQIVRVPVRAGATAHHDDDFSVTLLLDISDGLRDRIAGGFVELLRGHGGDDITDA